MNISVGQYVNSCTLTLTGEWVDKVVPVVNCLMLASQTSYPIVRSPTVSAHSCSRKAMVLNETQEGGSITSFNDMDDWSGRCKFQSHNTEDPPLGFDPSHVVLR